MMRMTKVVAMIMLGLVFMLEAERNKTGVVLGLMDLAALYVKDIQ